MCQYSFDFVENKFIKKSKFSWVKWFNFQDAIRWKNSYIATARFEKSWCSTYLIISDWYDCLIELSDG